MSATSTPVATTFVFGSQGSGKTVFLSSLYAYLTLKAHVTGYSLIARDSDQNKFLLNNFENLSGDHKWPDATAGEIEYRFGLSPYVFGRVGEPIRDIVYLDYAGANTTEVGMDFDPPTRAALSRASELVILIDGKLLGECVAGNASNRDRSKLNEFLIQSKKTVTHGDPQVVMAVITKWDHIKKLGLSLAQVKVWLAKNDRWDGIVESIKGRNDSGNVDQRELYLVPVSAVGDAFCDWNGNEFIARSGEDPHPYNLDVPTALAFGYMFKAAAGAAASKKAQTGGLD